MVHRRKLFSSCLLLVFLLATVCFSIYPADISAASEDPTFNVVSPGAGDVWAPGSEQTIEWNYTGNPGSQVTITLFKGSSSKIHIASKTATGSDGSGTFSWTIPATLAEGSDYRVKVLTPTCPEGGWSSYFTIGNVSGPDNDTGESTSQTTQTEEESFTIITPGAGDVWVPGSEQTIKWNYTGNPDSQVTITLFKGSSSKLHIASKTATGSDGSGTFSWTIPATLAEGSDYRVKVLTPTCPEGGWSSYFTIGSGDSTQQTTQSGTALINDATFVTLTAIKDSSSQYQLQVKANNASKPVEVSYLVLNSNASPTNPSQGIQVAELTESESTWGGSKQYYGHTEVGGWALPQYKDNPRTFVLPHYRTCVMMLARYEKIYVVFIRENDGILTYKVFQGGAFNGLNVPGLGSVTCSGSQFKIHSEGGALEVGIWDKGSYKHDEVTGWAMQSYAANDKTYDIPKYGMFMMTIGRYGKLGLIIGNYNDGQLGTVCFSGSQLLGTQSVSGLCEITSAGSPHIRVNATGNDPVEFSHFALDNTCWQWEVNGWGQADFQQNPQVLPLKHYTPGFFTCSRYDQAGIFFYNENDSQMGVLPLNSSTQAAASSAAATQVQTSVPAGAIKVYLNGQLLSFDQPPVIVGGRTLVPMRAIFEALGASISWDAGTRMVTAYLGDTSIKLIIGMQSAQVNGHETALEQPAQIMNGRTMVPLRFVAEALNCQVSWNGDTRTIYISQNTSAGGGTEQLTASLVIEKFFQMVDSGDVDSALTLLDTQALGNASSQAMWQSSLGSIDTASVTSIQNSNQAQWTNDYQQYQVNISLHLKPGSQTLWSEGQDTRWISLVKANGQWKISTLATSP